MLRCLNPGNTDLPWPSPAEVLSPAESDAQSLKLTSSACLLSWECLQVINLWLRNETCREFVFGKRLAQIAAQLMEVRPGSLKDGHTGTVRCR